MRTLKILAKHALIPRLHIKPIFICLLFAILTGYAMNLWIDYKILKYAGEERSRSKALELFKKPKVFALEAEENYKYAFHAGSSRRYSEFCKKPDKEFRVALVTVATGMYMTSFFPTFVESVGKYFFRNHNVSLFVFANSDFASLPTGIDLPEMHRIWLDTLTWPYSSMMRFGLLDQYKKILGQYDYIYLMDVDFIVRHDVCEDILGDLVGTIHWNYARNKGNPDHNPRSSAYIEPGTNKRYYAGGLYGGKSSRILDMASVIHNRIVTDLQKEPPVIARWHDESHINRYFLDNEPDRILSPEYCWMSYLPRSRVEGLNVEVKRIEHWDKEDDEFRWRVNP